MCVEFPSPFGSNVFVLFCRPSADTYIAPDALMQLRQQFNPQQNQRWSNQPQQVAASASSSLPLEEQEWYWGSITKSVARDEREKNTSSTLP